MSLTWLLSRLEQENTEENPERWKSIVATLKKLQRVDESTNCCPHEARIRRSESKIEAAPDRRLQFVPRTRQQNQSRGRPTPDSIKVTAGRDVGALRRAFSEGEIMNGGELKLVSVACALIGDLSKLTPSERKLAAKARPVKEGIVSTYRHQIAQGEDVLGTEFCKLRSAEKRRKTGATYTPPSIVKAMMSWAEGLNPSPDRVIDPGIGSGRFISSAAKSFPGARLIGIDIDPLALLMARANSCVLGYSRRLHLQLGDYRDLELPPCQGRTLFIGNPPYVRHHDIADRWKTWFATTARRYGLKASKLSGLHIHFFLRTREIANHGDYGAFITSAEWLDVNYGSTLRSMLADGLGGSAVHVIDPKAKPFSDAFTTGAVTCFLVGERPAHLALRAVDKLEDLAPLDKGRAVEWAQVAKSHKWSIFVRDHKPIPHGFIELGELFRAHRGQVTGANEAWIAGDMARLIPKRFLRPTVTKGRELLSAGSELASVANLKRVVDLPIVLDELTPEELKEVRKYLAWAKSIGAQDSYVAQQRRSWWAVELRAPAVALVTYMARRAPAFVLNTAGARHLNIAHGLYPREPIARDDLETILIYLRHYTSAVNGRVYAGGLVKFEPKELERLRLPRLEDIHGYLAEEKDIAKTVVAC
jgi:adenine-specific DNA-methyltransferase